MKTPEIQKFSIIEFWKQRKLIQNTTSRSRTKGEPEATHKLDLSLKIRVAGLILCHDSKHVIALENLTNNIVYNAFLLNCKFNETEAIICMTAIFAQLITFKVELTRNFLTKSAGCGFKSISCSSTATKCCFLLSLQCCCCYCFFLLTIQTVDLLFNLV